mmetsp:Transcript_57890/g.148909  ORF Transcript_57890/g.148909 Transcript_57890/m.148909 type:complete len:1227 (-) Transcript_57890:138-3818(-)
MAENGTSGPTGAPGFFVGKLVRIVGLSGRTVRAAQLVRSADLESFKDEHLEGQEGYCQGYDDEAKEYAVQTFDGLLACVPNGCLEEYRPPAAEDGGFDLAWPMGMEADLAFGQQMAQQLATKGFCVVQTFLSEEEREQALEVARAKPDRDIMKVKSELEVDIMGRSNASKAIQLPHDFPDQVPGDALLTCDRKLTEAGLLLHPYATPILGFESFGRSEGLVRMKWSSKAEADKYRKEPLSFTDESDGSIQRHIEFTQRRKIAMLYMIDNGGGSLTLIPKEGASTRIPLASNRLVLFRNDAMTYEYAPNGPHLALTSWMLTPAPAYQLTMFDGSAEEHDLVMNVEGPIRPDKCNAQIMSAATRFPGNSQDADQYWAMLANCTDADTMWPTLRCDSDLYYTSEPDYALTFKSYTNHGGWLTQMEVVGLDNKFFGISDDEAKAMSMNQRMFLEVGYEALFQAGMRKDTLDDKKIGTYLGDVGSDWHGFTGFFSIVFHDPELSATSLNSAVCPSRISFVYNLKGPTMTFDTACSASLVATHHAHMNMINYREFGEACDGSIAAGVNTLGESGFCGNCAANMLSHIGRCFTYDRTADGYQRGEGCGAFFLKLSEKYEVREERLAALVGTCANQDGRSASLTAPNGPSQQQVIKHSLRMAGITAEFVTAVECHGTGTALGDPIEVGALLAVLEDDREMPLPHTSAKSNISHLESAAGVAGLLKCLTILAHATATPNCHLKSLNPHLVTQGFPQLFESELVDTGATSGFMGVSSFGFGGTNSRADLYAFAQVGPRGRTQPNMEEVEIVSIPCPKCMGRMCWRCRVAIPSYAPKEQHYCTLVRDEFSDYEYCSDCYSGDFRYGEPIEDLIPWEASHRVSVLGTWNAWTEVEEMEQTRDGVYVCGITLGETRCESFQLIINENPENTLYPCCEKSNQSSRIVGPDGDGKGKNWVIDGKADMAPPGTVYQVTFEWGAKKQIRWEVAGGSLPMAIVDSEFKHRYYACGSWNRWQLQEMASIPDEPGAFSTTFVMGLSGREEFQCIRDRDWTQVFYPSIRGAEETSVPIRGPDDCGSGKNWLVRGDKGEAVTVEFRVVDAQVALTVRSDSMGEKLWESAVAEERMYCLTGFFNDWGFSPMMPDETEPGVYRYQITFEGRGAEEFQIVVDGDWGQRLYPRTSYSGSGGDFVQGPDENGDGLNWQLIGEAGVTYEIVLDLNQADRRRMVTWSVKLNRLTN